MHSRIRPPGAGQRTPAGGAHRSRRLFYFALTFVHKSLNHGLDRRAKRSELILYGGFVTVGTDAVTEFSF